MPPKLLGISDEAGGNDKSTDFQRVFDTKTMQPFMEKLQRRVTRAHAGVDVDFVIDHRYQMPKEDQVKLAGDFEDPRRHGPRGPRVPSNCHRRETIPLTISCSTRPATTVCQGNARRLPGPAHSRRRRPPAERQQHHGIRYRWRR